MDGQAQPISPQQHYAPLRHWCIWLDNRSRRNRFLSLVGSDDWSFKVNAPPAVAPAPRLTLTAEQEYIIREIIFKAVSALKGLNGFSQFSY
jgi:hypothetical protein